MPPTTRTSRQRGLNGHQVLYRYLQNELLSSDVWLFQMLTAKLVAGLGIWLDPEIYRRYPLLRPYAVRDPDSRGNPSRGIPDQWGAPDRSGVFRDDNSLVKRMPYTLTVRGAHSLYDGARVEKGYVASHVWRQLGGNNGLASRNRLTYSFVPNLVWLPSEVSKLSDREGSFVQGYIQALSINLYRHVEVEGALRPIVERAWSLLPEPDGIPAEGLPTDDQVNFFASDERVISRWRRDLRTVIDALNDAGEGRSIAGRVIASRYGPGLSSVPSRALEQLKNELANYDRAVESSGGTPRNSRARS